MIKTIKTLSLSILFISLGSHAGVNLKNGNFFMSYNDIVSTSKGVTFGLTRTYNSKSTKVGWFGYGWGTAYEAKLEVSLDGSVIIHENGSGGKSRFTKKGSSPAEMVGKSVKKILAEMNKKSKLAAKAEKELKEKLSNNVFYRHKMAMAYGIKGSVPVGTEMVSYNYGLQKLYVVKKGYKRVFETGRIQFFSRSGYLIASAEKNGYKVRLKRNKKTKLVEKILDSSGNQIFVKWNSDRRIESLATSGSRKAVFKYRGKDLIESVDINGLKYQYKYDSYHNMTMITDTSIKNKNNASIKIKYAPKTFFASEVRKRNGEVTKYVYESSKKNPDLHYWTTVVKQGIGGEPYANKYEYEHKRNADGAEWLYRTVFTTGADYKNKKLIGGIIRETLNNALEQPVKIKQGKKVTDFKYKNGFMVSKRSNDGTFVELEYNQRFKKVSKIKNNEGWTEYEYNKKGELKKAKDKTGRAILLVYDIGGKITKMVDQIKKVKRILSFRYNSQGRPIEIAMDKKGKIEVEYDTSGQVRRVNSKGGRRIASEVSSTFQNLLTIVRPAGVNLSI